MFDPKILTELSQKLIDLLPADTHILKQDLENNMRIILQSTFKKMDLVTREEFDIQTAVLARTRQKLEALEQQIAELENNKPS